MSTIQVGVPKETAPGETLVALVPAHVPLLVKMGFEVSIESGAGEAAGFEDDVYRSVGARVVAGREELYGMARILLQVRTPGANREKGRDDLALLRPGHIVVGLADPLGSPHASQEVAETGATLLALELMPRISRAQSMDALSSLATVAGYKAALLAAGASSKLFPMLTTAAGTIPPARVLVIGAGVAGLQAIATARRLGAAVSAYDVRPSAKEDIRSVGAKVVEFLIDARNVEGTSGYARDLDEETYRQQQAGLASVVEASDVVITTASVPGRKAPILITEEMIKRMSRGAVVVDAAADRGGNCEVTRPNETVVHRGVTVLGPANLPALVPTHASRLYGKNLVNLLHYLLPRLRKEGDIGAATDDEIVKEILVARNGGVVHQRVNRLLEAG
ncbi:MAG: NAD(P) transhydrogenase subunit alpha [Nitrospira sp.]|nr:NAD(P) transhydrogenase subunit alpha [Nitrospira sp.]MCP9461553.1 NAD(P) transhydrogenase subunit alpha [Nitrospira sp.]